MIELTTHLIFTSDGLNERSWNYPQATFFFFEKKFFSKVTIFLKKFRDKKNFFFFLQKKIILQKNFLDVCGNSIYMGFDKKNFFSNTTFKKKIRFFFQKQLELREIVTMSPD